MTISPPESRHVQRLSTGWMLHVGELPIPPARLSSKGGGCGSVSDLLPEEQPTSVALDQELARMATMVPGVEQLLNFRRVEVLDSTWRPVEIPHDWRIEQTPQPDGPPFQAFLPGGVAYYRLRFAVPPSELGRRLTVEFDGVLSDATVWCNGFLLGNHPSGYAGFRFDLTDFLRYGDEGENVLLVRCDTTDPEGWWYEGGGIYREVRLISRASIHIADDGIWVTTPEVTPDRALIRVVSTLVNTTTRSARAQITTTLIAPNGTSVGSAERSVEIPACSSFDSVEELTVESPQLWEVGQGRLYRARVELRSEENLDEDVTTFGIRTVGFRGDEGFFVNDQPVLIQGANLHQDFAGVGVALPDRLVAYKLELLAEMGCNAVRSAHHPPSTAFLNAADHLGLLVIAENRLLSSAPDYLQDLEWLIRHNRNHPSIFLWSLENEEALQGTARGKRLLRTLTQRARQLDPTRQISVGGAFHLESDYFDVVDVIGTHYAVQNGFIEQIRRLRPGHPHLSDEEGLFPTVRGQYEDDEERGLASAFGTKMGLFGVLPTILAQLPGMPSALTDIGKTWQWFADHPQSGGGFVWAGMDYFGEPVQMSYPSVGSSYGALDICGYPKDYYWLLRSFFRTEPLIHVVPHWTWPGHEGKLLRLWVYTNCEEVELLLNGQVVGRRQAQAHIARWDEGLAYQPGELIARGYNHGSMVVETLVQTAGPGQALRLEIDRATICGDGRDVALAHVAVVDDQGRLNPWAESEVRFTIEGPARLIGVGNGNPSSMEPHKSNRRRAFRGRCLAIIQSQIGASGTVRLRVQADGLREAEATLVVEPEPQQDAAP
jgi:beta-galactosidase